MAAMCSVLFLLSTVAGYAGPIDCGYYGYWDAEDGKCEVETLNEVYEHWADDFNRAAPFGAQAPALDIESFDYYQNTNPFGQ